MFLTLHGALAFGSISHQATATAAASRRNLITVFPTAEAAAASSALDKKEGPIKNEQAYANLKMDEIVSLCKRRGIIFPSSEIYNGFAGFFNYGPLSSELKRNVKDAFWKTFVHEREDVVGIDSSIIHNPTTWKSSGHLDGFSDPMVDCLFFTNRTSVIDGTWTSLLLLIALELGGQSQP